MRGVVVSKVVLALEYNKNERIMVKKFWTRYVIVLADLLGVNIYQIPNQ